MVFHNGTTKDIYNMEWSSSTSVYSRSTDRSALIPQKASSRPGMSLLVTVLFIMGYMAGTGVLALPRAIEDTGWIGMVLIAVLGALSAYTGILLGWSWDIVEERYGHDLDEHTQDPYPVLGEMTFGKPGRIVAKICIYTTVFGTGVVFLLLSADILTEVINTAFRDQHISICYVTLVLGGILIPLFWLGTPVDFWPMGIGALVSTLCACTLITAYSYQLQGDKLSTIRHDTVQIKPFAMAVGSIAFTFSGHASLPTIQQDMDDRRKFAKAVSLSFTGVVCIYILVTLTGYIFLGNILSTNILGTLASIQPGWPVYVAQILLFLHLVAGNLIVMNPINQDLEKVFNVPNRFSWRRILLRTTVTVLLIFTGESIPRFAVLLSLVGGSAITVVIFILPVCMYERLCRQKGPWPKVEIPLYQTVLHVEILLIGILVFISSSISALEQIVGPDSFVPPCYVNVTSAKV